ncbi:hypothetical protein NHF46_14865 [Arthrobacter alpinus]|nr:hypothetical protein [Arthrobacter alpinus]
MNERRQTLSRAQEPGDALLVALRQQATAKAAAQEAAGSLAEALADSAFSDATQVREALLAPAEAAAVERQIKDHAQAVAVNIARLADPDVVLATEEAQAVSRLRTRTPWRNWCRRLLWPRSRRKPVRWSGDGAQRGCAVA